MEPHDIVYFKSAELFRKWLEKNHATETELWVGDGKKSTGRPSVTWEETVDEALCFGWIDGIRKRVDGEPYAICFTPRRKKSSWSRRNIERFKALSADYLARLWANRGTWRGRPDLQSRPKCGIVILYARNRLAPD